MLASTALSQQAIMEGKKAVVCKDEPIKCPLGHDSCKSINMPLAVGNDSYDYPEVAQLRGKNVLMCEQCGMLFIKL